MEIKLKSIGIAKNKAQDHFGGWKKSLTDIIIDEKYVAALAGLQEYSHVVIVYFMHEVSTYELRHVPQGKVGQVPKVGIFACRCANRPNPIGISVGKIIAIKNNVLKVEGLDVINNTPIIDIKPYTPQYDKVEDAKFPEWVNKLEY